MLAAERDEHSKICQEWLCGICLQRMKASEGYEHLPNCPVWRCTHCIKKFPRSAKDEHIQSDDDEISQSGIDELLYDDDEIWEDFSNDEPLEDILDDESAGHLLMRFEEKHALDDSVDDSN